MRCSLADTQSSGRQIGKRSVTSTSDDIFHISSISITSTKGKVASISPFDVPIGYIDPNNLQVKGDLSGTSSDGYLEITWRDPSALAIGELGEFTCEISTVDHHNQQVVFSSSLEITEVAPTINDVVSEFQNMKQKQSQDIQRQEQAVEDLKQQLSGLQTTIQAQDSVINDLKQKQSAMRDCASRREGFMAVMSSGFIAHGKTVSNGQTAVFDKAIYSAGNGYDTKTGIFTCQEAGVYSFSVSSLSSYNRDVRLSLMLNSDIVASSYGHDQNPAAASADVVLHLNKNDQVKVVSASGGFGVSDFFQDANLLKGNVFVGHLEQSDCVL